MYEGAQTYFKMKSTEVATFQHLCSQESLCCTGCGEHSALPEDSLKMSVGLYSFLGPWEHLSMWTV